MLEQIKPLWDTYLKKRQANEPLVLATLFETIGSSYKKAGAMMLIEQDRTTHGLISGGCLEADVAEHAQALFESKTAMVLTYDLSDESIFGLGAGCNGTIKIVLQILTGEYLPFSALNPKADHGGPISLCIETEQSSEFTIGNFCLKSKHKLIESTPGLTTSAAAMNQSMTFTPPPKIVICGAGIDVMPLLQIMSLLYWDINLVDHSPARLQLNSRNLDVQTIVINNQTLEPTLSSLDCDAAIIMSHNIKRDSQYLTCFASKGTPWIGLLGPHKRRDKILKSTGIELAQIKNRLHAPIGLDIGGRMPANIAVSIVAQLQAHFYQP